MTEQAMIPLIRHEVFEMIDKAALAETSKEKYSRVVEAYLEAGHSLSDAATLSRFAQGLSPSRRAHLKAAVKLWTTAMTHQVKVGVTPETVAVAQAAVMRFEALQDAIQVQTAKGEKAHIWLSKVEVKRLMGYTGQDVCHPVAGKRDRVALGLLVGAGLRREEAVALTFANVKLQPVKGKLRTVLQVVGKGSKDRLVPISDTLAEYLSQWSNVVGGHGLVLRSVGRGGRIGRRLSAVGLFKLVEKYGRFLDKPELAPHDLRRTYAQIGYESGIPLTQISKLLGHESVATTQRYLNLELNLETTISDFVPMG